MFSKLSKHTECSLLLLRLAVGAVFIYYGLAKFTYGEIPLLMQVLAYVEPIVGVALILGSFVRISSVIISIIMLGAIWTKLSAGQTALTEWALDLVLLASAIVIMTHGPGKWSLEAKVGLGKGL